MKRWLLPVLVAMSVLAKPPTTVLADTHVVNAILFYDPNSLASQQVFSDVLPPVVAKQGEHLVIYMVDITREDGRALLQSAIEALRIPAGSQTPPLLIIGNTVLSGMDEIKSSFPTLADYTNGMDWPAIPGLQDALQKAGIAIGPQGPWQKFLNDQPGNTLAVIVLAGLAISLVYSILSTFHLVKDISSYLPVWKLPLLLLFGVIISSYLSYTELTRSEVLCGGLSNCQAVQDSQYSHILGIIPVGVFGLAGNLLIGLTWATSRISRGSLRSISTLAMLGFAVFGASCSLYLTFLEPFVIGAACLWCLGSAIVMGLVLPCTAGPVRELIKQYSQPGKEPSPASG
jgi:uncharacterized membrane protein